MRDRLGKRSRWSCLGFAILLGGCSPSGPVRYELSGAATLDGQNIPSGAIMLEPDASRGNKGPGGVAEIHDGRYVTQPGRGVLGGAYIGRITAYDGRPPAGADANLMPWGRITFGPKSFPLDLPQADSTHDFHLTTR